MAHASGQNRKATGKRAAPGSPALVILAAGMGSRYGGLKQIDPVGPEKETVLDYSVFDALRAGFEKVVFVIRHDIERAFRTAIGDRFEAHLEVHYAFQGTNMLPRGILVPQTRQKPWGTGHALWCASGVVKEPCAVINADDFYGAESFRVMAEFLRQPQPAEELPTYAMVGFQLEPTLSEHGTVARGICETNAEGFLTSVEELTKLEKTASGARNYEPDGTVRALTGQEIVSMNFWGFQPSIFQQLEVLFSNFLRQQGESQTAEFYIPFAVNSLIQGEEARVRVLPTASRWFGVTYREDRDQVVRGIRQLIQAGQYPERLWT